ncbi:hypothetical protein DAPPUDRAFT_238980 [Daphnia pulex]|uniref:Uncharacterized protein n=1 Tax=Daphnia pulex TaxID=6669 RepID=E9G7X6_DAPPU|nr:hypothetical protein DAPPUDRAFT_238980 [Daphnia pulex]|eukprot:EFX84559.1 hypothetical protein DAPPUDRAFT_238980 [Daphnia pulex]
MKGIQASLKSSTYPRMKKVILVHLNHPKIVVYSSGRQQKLKLVPQNLNKVRVMNNKDVNGEETILSASSLLEMSPMQPKRSDMDHIQHDAILSALRGIRGEGVTCEAVMKDNMEHFKKVVKSQVSLPILVPEEISVLNAALCDMELSICLIQNLRTLGSKDKIAKAVLIAIFSRALCSKVQWKKRGKDLRIGIGHLINLVAVFGVVINKVLEMHKQPQLAVSAVVCAVQNARRYHGYEYAKSVTAAACSSTEIDELDDEEECHSRADKEKNMAIDRRMLELNKAILEYNPPNGVDHPEMRIMHGIQVIRWLRNTSVGVFTFSDAACNLGREFRFVTDKEFSLSQWNILFSFIRAFATIVTIPSPSAKWPGLRKRSQSSSRSCFMLIIKLSQPTKIRQLPSDSVARRPRRDIWASLFIDKRQQWTIRISSTSDMRSYTGKKPLLRKIIRYRSTNKP